MDLIYTNSKKVDQGVLNAYTLDLSFGAEENDFEISLGADEPRLEFGALIYAEGSEYGGIVDAIGSDSTSEAVSYMGRTFHGVLNSKVIEPDEGKDYFTISGEANTVLRNLIDRLNLGGLFVASEVTSNIYIANYQFNRYCKAYDGIRAMLSSVGAKLKIAWKNRAVQLSAEPIVDYSEESIDNDATDLIVEFHDKKVNHLICLGRGELANREVIHLYVDQFGRIGDTQYYTGLDEITEIYDNNGAESSDELRSGGIENLTELRSVDNAEISLPAAETSVYDIGDIVGASDINSGIKTAAAVTQKIVKITNGATIIEYKIGG